MPDILINASHTFLNLFVRSNHYPFSPSSCFKPSVYMDLCLFHLPKLLFSTARQRATHKTLLDLQNVNHSLILWPIAGLQSPRPSQTPSSRTLATMVFIESQVQNLSLYWSGWSYYLMNQAFTKLYISLYIDSLYPHKTFALILVGSPAKCIKYLLVNYLCFMLRSRN